MSPDTDRSAPPDDWTELDGLYVQELERFLSHDRDRENFRASLPVWLDEATS